MLVVQGGVNHGRRGHFLPDPEAVVAGGEPRLSWRRPIAWSQLYLRLAARGGGLGDRQGVLVAVGEGQVLGDGYVPLVSRTMLISFK